MPLERIDFENRQFQFRCDPRPGSLVESIRSCGVQVPLVVRPLPNDSGRYQAICGFRRGSAAHLAGLDRVPVIVRDLSDAAARLLSYADNEERKTFDDLDRAHAIVKFREAGHTIPQIAELMDLSDRRVQHLQALAAYPDVLKRAVADEDSGVTTTHALALMQAARKLGPRLDVARWVKRIRVEKLSLSQLKREIRKEARPQRLRRKLIHRRGDIVSFNLKRARSASDEERKHARLELEQLIKKTLG